MPDVVTIALETKNLDGVRKFLTSATERLDDWTGGAEGMVTIIRDDIRLRFQNAPAVETGGIVLGDVFWRPLNEGYLMARPDRRGGKMLTDTGALKASVTEDTAESFTEITSEQIRVGTTLPYAGKINTEFPFIFWHPILLERVTDYLITWYLTGKGENSETR